MSKEKIDLLIEGGKATATPALAQQLGPLKINIGEVLNQVNTKTLEFKGIKVPVKVLVDTNTKEIQIYVGSPPVSELLKKELNLQKGSSSPNKIKSANISIEQVIKIAKMKQDAMYTPSLKAAVKTVIGSCNSAGILVESKIAKDVAKEVVAGKYDTEINQGKTEPSAEKKKELAEFFKKVEADQKKLVEAAAAAAAAAPKVEEKKAEEGKTAAETKKPEEKKEAGKKEAAKPAAKKK